MALVDPGIGIDPFAQFRVLTRLHAYPFGRVVVRVGRIASVGACGIVLERVHLATH
jgi:hypothetical protein